MPTVAVFDMTGKKTGEMELNAAVFGIEPNMTVVHAAVKNYLANQRQGTQSTLTRAEVRVNVVKSAANVPGVRTTIASTLNVYEILNADKFIIDKAAIEKLQEVYA